MQSTFLLIVNLPGLVGREGRGKGGGSPGEQGAGRVREAGEERAGSGSPKRVGSRREMQNANYCQLLTP